MRKLPPLNAVRSFEAAARHASFTRAAGELHVTHGAISRQVAQLEDWFGVKLFRRAPSQITLTDAGRDYYREVTALLDRLALASMEVKQHAALSTLRISAPPTFMMRWLIRRSSSFQRRHADVELRLNTSRDPVRADDGGFDIAIRGEQEEIPGWTSCRFMTELIAPVCHADVLAQGHLATLDGVRNHRLISYLTEPYSWAEWLDHVGTEMPEGQETQRFEQMYFALQAVQDKLGIGLFPLFLITDELETGQLRVPFDTLGLRKRDYCCFYRNENAHLPVIADFRNWLIGEGAQTERATLAFAKTMGWKF